jgi:hypothetical protein
MNQFDSVGGLRVFNKANSPYFMMRELPYTLAQTSLLKQNTIQSWIKPSNQPMQIARMTKNTNLYHIARSLCFDERISKNENDNQNTIILLLMIICLILFLVQMVWLIW